MTDARGTTGVEGHLEAGSPGPATLLAALWTICLVVLAALWIQTPFSGPGRMFLLWTVATVPLVSWSWSRFRRWGIRQVPRSALFLAGLAVVWAGVAWLADATFPGIWAMDGLIMREPLLRAAGKTLQWLPGLFGLALSVGGLSAALEARYRLAHDDTEDLRGEV